MAAVEVARTGGQVETTTSSVMVSTANPVVKSRVTVVIGILGIVEMEATRQVGQGLVIFWMTGKLLVTGMSLVDVTGIGGQVGQGLVMVTVTGNGTVIGVPVAIDPVGMGAALFLMGKGGALVDIGGLVPPVDMSMVPVP